jgi:hypothetical protein
MDVWGWIPQFARLGRRFAVWLLLPTLLAATALVSAEKVVGAAGSTCKSWTYTYTPPLVPGGVLNAVGGTSPCNVWAAGFRTQATGSLIEHWNGTSWQVQTSNNPGGFINAFNGVAATSSSNAWAVGLDNDFSTNHTLIEHWNGTSWGTQTSLDEGTSDTLTGVTAPSASNAWAVGYYNNGSVNQTLIEHWNGTSWLIQASPNNLGFHGQAVNNELDAVAATSSTNAWAAGSYFSFSLQRYQTLIEHWNGVSWQIQPSADAGTMADHLTGVGGTSTSNAWAVGYSNNGTVDQTLIEHWNGTSWKVQTSPDVGTGDNLLLAVAARSTGTSTHAWAVGHYNDGTADQTLIEQWNGTAWSLIPSGSPGESSDLYGIAAVSSSSVWGVGEEETGATNPQQPLVEHCC